MRGFGMKYKTYLLLGAPGSGKGTQGKILGSIPRLFHLSMGDVFRALDTRTAIGQKFIDYSSRGQLVPDEITMELLRAHIGHLVGIHAFKPDIDSLVLDGVPRNLRQAEIMRDMIEVRRVFHLSCPDREQLVLRRRTTTSFTGVCTFFGAGSALFIRFLACFFVSHTKSILSCFSWFYLPPHHSDPAANLD